MKAFVFVTIGTHSQQFDRLLKKIDEIAREKKDITFFAQTGNSEYNPQYFSYKKFLNEKEYEQNFRTASIVISHGGAGSIIHTLKLKKPLIVVPRLKKFREHTNDHQLDLGEFFEKKGKCICVKEIEGLEKAIERSKKFKPKIEIEKQGLITEIKNFLEKNEESWLKK